MRDLRHQLINLVAQFDLHKISQLKQEGGDSNIKAQIIAKT